MKILALDCATTSCSCAVLIDGRVQAHCFTAMARGQGAQLIPVIGQTMAAGGWSHGCLDAYAVTTGPGSFTGLRIGLAAAKAMALAAAKPLIGMPTLTVMAWPLFAQHTQPTAAPTPRPDAPPACVACLLQSGRGDVYLQLFQPCASPPPMRPTGDIMVGTNAQVDAWIPRGAHVTGHVPQDLWDRLNQRRDIVRVPPGKTDGRPDAGALAECANSIYAKQKMPTAMPTLIYGRPHYAAKPNEDKKKPKPTPPEHG